MFDTLREGLLFAIIPANKHEFASSANANAQLICKGNKKGDSNILRSELCFTRTETFGACA